MDYRITKWETHGAFDTLQVEYRRDFLGGNSSKAAITIKPYHEGCMIDFVSGVERHIYNWNRETDGSAFTIRIAGEEERKGILRLFKCLIKEMEGDMAEKEAELDILYPSRKESRGL